MIGLAAMVLLLGAGTLLAQGPGGYGGMSGGPMMGPGSGGGPQGGLGMEHLERFRMMFRGLDLTEEQAEEIRSIVGTAREEARELIEAAGPVEDGESFMDIFTSPALTVRDLEESIDQMDEVRDQVRGIVLQAIVDVHDVLTAEQLQRLAEMADEYGHGAGGWSGAGPGPGGGRW
ncbi:MAG: hypothetical protein AVO35_08865 [Candidatus Aegiribacteria sp. MLS_C]|nr:MAG: hypothetical protein AVO35_08865 [Candidatus Aegiribacteria sp. MLS_C]